MVSFRYTVISGLNPSALEAAFHYAAKAVSDRVATTPGGVFERLKPIYVDDAKMRQDFAGLEVGTGRPQEKVGQVHPGAVGGGCIRSGMRPRHRPPAPSSTSCPRIRRTNGTKISITPRWDASVYRIGNLTLLEAATNRSIGNATLSRQAGRVRREQVCPQQGKSPGWRRSSGRRSSWRRARCDSRRAPCTCGESTQPEFDLSAAASTLSYTPQHRGRGLIGAALTSRGRAS